MLRLMACLTILSFSLSHAQESSADETDRHITIPSALPGTEGIHSYISGLIEMALIATEKDFGSFKLVQKSYVNLQANQLISLNAGSLDMAWTITDVQREQEYNAVHFPLMAGLFGFRVFLAMPNGKVRASTSLQELQQLSMVQGFDWPDLEILKHNGFNVRPSNYDTAFALLKTGYIDLFPRSVSEAFEEQSLHPSLIIEPFHTLYYPNFLLVFTAKNNEQLAKRLTQGLALLQHENKIQPYLQQQPFYQRAVNALRDRTVHTLQVPAMTDASKALNNHPLLRELRQRL